MADAHLPWTANHPDYAEKWYFHFVRAELLSIEPWNTATDGTAGCEDMPRKSIDIKLTDYPIPAEKGLLRPFPDFRRGWVRATPDNGVKGRVPCGFLGRRPEPSESLSVSISAIFKVRSSLIFSTRFFHSSLDTTGDIYEFSIKPGESIVKYIYCNNKY